MGICPDEKNARERAEEYYLSSFASAFRSFSFEFLKTNIVIASKAIVIVWTLLFHYHQVNIIESILSLLSYYESTICRILLSFVRWSGDQIRPNIAILSSRHWFFKIYSSKKKILYWTWKGLWVNCLIWKKIGEWWIFSGKDWWSILFLQYIYN